MKKIIFFAFTFVIGNALSADFFKLGIPDLLKKREPYTCNCISNRFESENYCIKTEINKDQFVEKYKEFKHNEEMLTFEEEMSRPIGCKVDCDELEVDRIISLSDGLEEMVDEYNAYTNKLKKRNESLEKQLEDIVIGKYKDGRGWTTLPGNDNSKAWCKVFQTLANRKVKLSEIKFNEEKARKEKEEKARIAKEKKEEKARIAKEKKNRDNRGKYGVSFNMTKNDLPDYCKNRYEGFIYQGVFCDAENREFEVEFRPDFVDIIKRDMGEYTISEFNKIVKTLNNRYKLIKKPSMADKEKFMLADYGNVYFFENESGFDSSAGVFDKKRGPKYIEFSVTTEKNYDVIMYLYYYSTHHFEENILPKINKEKNKLNDI